MAIYLSIEDEARAKECADRFEALSAAYAEETGSALADAERIIAQRAAEQGGDLFVKDVLSDLLRRVRRAGDGHRCGWDEALSALRGASDDTEGAERRALELAGVLPCGKEGSE